MSSLYEQLGGEAAVDAAVTLFYQKVLADERINHFFTNVDMEKQARHQKRFLSYAFGGFPDYPGRTLAAAHQQLVRDHGLNDQHFDAVAENLQATLQDLGIEAGLIEQVMQIAGSTRETILGRATPA